jgi:hypothetical protein
MSLADALERAASELTKHEDAIRDANGDPDRLVETLGEAGAGPVLVWLLENEAEAGEELAMAWTESEAGAAPLQAVDAKALKKSGRKVLRKALHRLRSRGVEMNASEQAPVVAHVGAVEDSFERALVSPIDPRGTRMAYLVEPHPAGGARMYEAILDDSRGIVDFRVYSAGRSKVRTFLKDVGARSSTPMFDVESSELRALIARAVARQAQDNPAPRAFIEHRSQLQLDAKAATPGDRAAAHFGSVEATDEILDGLAERARMGAVGPWPPDFDLLRKLGEDVKAHLEELGEGAVLSGEKQDPKTRAVLATAAQDLYGGEFGPITAHRLREAAFVFWQRDKEDEARQCLAAATVFESGVGVGENAVALAFIEVLVAPLVAQAAADDAELATDVSEGVSEPVSEDDSESAGQ